ncbi:MAG: HEPN domain-containing protein [Synechococcaceae bacterium WB8_1B_136]|nr:HEPN domain-containing protein [Synechococcaceae bacterium WB8_1B_136]
MAELTPLIKAWIRFTEEDWDDALILSRSGGKPRSICFHAQQRIEKLFKADLMRLQAIIPKIHNLRELSDLLHQADDSWQATSIDLNRLSLAAVDLRYPDPNEPNPEIEIALVLQIALDLRLRLLQRLGAEP